MIARRADRVVGARHHQLVGVQAKGEVTLRLGYIGGDEAGVLDLDRQLLIGHDQPVAAIGLAIEQAREGADHRGTRDLRAFVIPAAVGGDPHVAVIDIVGRPLLDRGQLALGHGLGDLRERHSGEFGGRSVRHGASDGRTRMLTQ